jgi:hypothetical protein
MVTWHALLEWRRAHSWRMVNREWRKLLVEGFIIFYMGLLLSNGIHTTKSA